MTTDLKLMPGQRVKVSYETTYHDYYKLGPDNHCHRAKDESADWRGMFLIPADATIEVLAPPEREWKHGDVVLDSDGDAFVRGHRADAYGDWDDGWYWSEGFWTDDQMCRPLQLIREGL